MLYFYGKVFLFEYKHIVCIHNISNLFSLIRAHDKNGEDKHKGNDYSEIDDDNSTVTKEGNKSETTNKVPTVESTSEKEVTNVTTMSPGSTETFNSTDVGGSILGSIQF